MICATLGSFTLMEDFPPAPHPLLCQRSIAQEPCRLLPVTRALLRYAVVGLVPQTPTASPALPEMQSLRLLIEELNSRVLLGNCLLGAGAERADVISEPGAADPQPRAALRSHPQSLRLPRLPGVLSGRYPKIG